MVFDNKLALGHLVQHVGELTGACRSYWFDYNAEDKTFDNSYEWCRESIESHQHRLRNVTKDTLPWVFGKFLKHESGLRARSKSTYQLSTDALQKQIEVGDHLKDQGISSVAIVPVIRGKMLSGFFGIDSTKEGHDWRKDERVLDILNHAAYALSACVQLGHKLPWTPGRTIPVDIDDGDISRMLNQTSTFTSIDDMTDMILCEFEKIRKSAADDRWDEIGRGLFRDKVKAMMTEDRTLAFLLPAFPFKSTNTQKVLGVLPDVSEKLAVQTLHRFARRCSEIYARGAVVVVVSDGRVYADIAGAQPENVSLYQEAMKTWFPSPYIRWVGLKDMLNEASDDVKRERLVVLYGSNLQEMDQRIKEDKAYNLVYNGFKELFKQENLGLINDAPESERLEVTEDAARLAMQRNEAYSNAVGHLFSTHIRLSIHPHDNVQKFGINLVGSTDWGTPWHNAALYTKDRHWQLISRSQAEKQGHQLKYDPQGLPYFQQI